MSDELEDLAGSSGTPRDRPCARHHRPLALLTTLLGFGAKVTGARTVLDVDHRAALGELAAATNGEIAADPPACRLERFWRRLMSDDEQPQPPVRRAVAGEPVRAELDATGEAGRGRGAVAAEP